VWLFSNFIFNKISSVGGRPVTDDCSMISCLWDPGPGPVCYLYVPRRSCDLTSLLSPVFGFSSALLVPTGPVLAHFPSTVKINRLRVPGSPSRRVYPGRTPPPFQQVHTEFWGGFNWHDGTEGSERQRHSCREERGSEMRTRKTHRKHTKTFHFPYSGRTCSVAGDGREAASEETTDMRRIRVKMTVRGCDD